MCLLLPPKLTMTSGLKASNILDELFNDWLVVFVFACHELFFFAGVRSSGDDYNGVSVGLRRAFSTVTTHINA